MAWDAPGIDHHAASVDTKVELTHMVMKSPGTIAQPLSEQLENLIKAVLDCHHYVDTMEEQLHGPRSTTAKDEAQKRAPGVFVSVNVLQQATAVLHDRLMKLSEQL